MTHQSPSAKSHIILVMFRLTFEFVDENTILRLLCFIFIIEILSTRSGLMWSNQFFFSSKQMFTCPNRKLSTNQFHEQYFLLFVKDFYSIMNISLSHHVDLMYENHWKNGKIWQKFPQKYSSISLIANPLVSLIHVINWMLKKYLIAFSHAIPDRVISIVLYLILKLSFWCEFEIIIRYITSTVKCK